MIIRYIKNTKNSFTASWSILHTPRNLRNSKHVEKKLTNRMEFCRRWFVQISALPTFGKLSSVTSLSYYVCVFSDISGLTKAKSVSDFTSPNQMTTKLIIFKFERIV